MDWIKRYLPRTLLGRSLLIIVSPLVLLQLIAAYIFYERHWDTVTHRLAGTLAGEVALIVTFLEDFPGEADRAWILHMAETRMAIRARFEPGAKLPREEAEAPPDELDRMLIPFLDERIDQPFEIDTSEIDRDIVIKVQLPNGLLIASTTRKRLFSPTTYIFILWMVGSSLVLVAIATVFMRNQVRPIRRLAAAANSFGKGRDVPEFRPAGAAEVRQAAHAFIEMRDRIKRQIEQRTEMLAGVSHDLRTPLTRMKLQLAMMKGEGIGDLTDDHLAGSRHLVDRIAAANRHDPACLVGRQLIERHPNRVAAECGSARVSGAAGEGEPAKCGRPEYVVRPPELYAQRENHQPLVGGDNFEMRRFADERQRTPRRDPTLR